MPRTVQAAAIGLGVPEGRTWQDALAESVARCWSDHGRWPGKAGPTGEPLPVIPVAAVRAWLAPMAKELLRLKAAAPEVSLQSDFAKKRLGAIAAALAPERRVRLAPRLGRPGLDAVAPEVTGQILLAATALATHFDTLRAMGYR